MRKRFWSALVLALALVVLMPRESLACPICFGGIDPDSQIGQGMNWAVFTLLGVTGGGAQWVCRFHPASRQALAAGSGSGLR